MKTSLSIPTARAFLPLISPARYKGAYGGRGSGKSHNFADMAIERCVMQPGARIVCVREVQKTLAQSVKLLLEDKIQQHEAGAYFDVKHDRIDTAGGGLILFQGMSDHTAESIKSLEGFDVAYVEEAQTLTKRSLELLRPTIRKPNSELWFSWNPRHASDPVDQFFRGLVLPPDATIVRANYKDNPFFPAVLEADRAFDEVNNRERYAHIWLGEYEPAAIGAIWDRLMFHNGRRETAPDLEQIVVSIDPAVGSEETSNEHGITVEALGADGRGYLLDDVSMRGGPREWATRSIAAYDRYDADTIVIEVNQGGDMVRNTLETVRPGLPITEVRATRGKHVRAEPIAALYANGQISHIGAFPEVEDQMCLMTASGYDGEGSPDRLDSVVWGFTHLFPEIVSKIEKPRAERPRYRGAGSWMN